MNDVSLSVLPDIRTYGENVYIYKQIIERVHTNVDLYSRGLKTQKKYCVTIMPFGSIQVKFPSNYLRRKVKCQLDEKVHTLSKFDVLCQQYNWSIHDYDVKSVFASHALWNRVLIFVSLLLISVLCFTFGINYAGWVGLGTFTFVCACVSFLFCVVYCFTNSWNLTIIVKYKEVDHDAIHATYTNLHDKDILDAVPLDD